MALDLQKLTDNLHATYGVRQGQLIPDTDRYCSLNDLPHVKLVFPGVKRKPIRLQEALNPSMIPAKAPLEGHLVHVMKWGSPAAMTMVHESLRRALVHCSVSVRLAPADELKNAIDAGKIGSTGALANVQVYLVVNHMPSGWSSQTLKPIPLGSLFAPSELTDIWQSSQAEHRIRFREFF